jgi:hypothetical protein
VKLEPPTAYTCSSVGQSNSLLSCGSEVRALSGVPIERPYEMFIVKSNQQEVGGVQNICKVLFLMVLLSTQVYAQNVHLGVRNAAGESRRVNVEAPLPTLNCGIIASPTFYRVNLATNTVKFLSQIASMTPPCNIEFQSAGVYCLGPATTTVALVQNQTSAIASGFPGKWSLEIATSSIDFGLILNSGETASAITLIHWPKGSAR